MLVIITSKTNKTCLLILSLKTIFTILYLIIIFLVSGKRFKTSMSSTTTLQDGSVYKILIFMKVLFNLRSTLLMYVKENQNIQENQKLNFCTPIRRVFFSRITEPIYFTYVCLDVAVVTQTTNLLKFLKITIFQTVKIINIDNF